MGGGIGQDRGQPDDSSELSERNGEKSRDSRDKNRGLSIDIKFAIKIFF